MRFPLEVVIALIESLDIPVMVRLSASDLVPFGINPDDSKLFARKLQELGVVALNMIATKRGHKVEIYTNSRVTSVANCSVSIENSKGELIEIVDIEQIIVATGMKSYHPFELTIPFTWIGDALKPGKAEEAIKAGYEIALSL